MQLLRQHQEHVGKQAIESRSAVTRTVHCSFAQKQLAVFTSLLEVPQPEIGIRRRYKRVQVQHAVPVLVCNLKVLLHLLQAPVKFKFHEVNCPFAEKHDDDVDVFEVLFFYTKIPGLVIEPFHFRVAPPFYVSVADTEPDREIQGFTSRFATLGHVLQKAQGFFYQRGGLAISRKAHHAVDGYPNVFYRLIVLLGHLVMTRDVSSGLFDVVLEVVLKNARDVTMEHHSLGLAQFLIEILLEDVAREIEFRDNPLAATDTVVLGYQMVLFLQDF